MFLSKNKNKVRLYAIEVKNLKLLKKKKKFHLNFLLKTKDFKWNIALSYIFY